MKNEKDSLALLREYLGNDTQQIKEMIELFLEKIPEDLRELSRLNHRKDYKNLRKTAHRLKSSVKLFGMQEAAGLLQKLETSDDKKMEDGRLSSLVQHVSTSMEKELNRLKQQLESL